MAALARPKQDQFVPHAIKVAEAARARCGNPETLDDEGIAAARLSEIHQWKNDVRDLHRVLEVAQGMFLLLEHNNEALLRVAIEIVCDMSATKVLWWTEGWYSDEEQRVYFREMVLGMLAKCMAYMNVEAEPQDTEKMEALEEKLKKALERCSQLEAAQAAADQKKMGLESQLKDLEAQLAEKLAREKDMQQANDRLKEELKAERENKSDGPDPALVAELEKLKKDLKTNEEQKKMMEEKFAKDLAKAKADAADPEAAEAARLRILEMEQKLKDEEARAKDAEKKAADAAKQIAALKADAAKGKGPKTVTDDKEVHRLEGQVHDLENSLENEKKHSAELEDANAKMKKEMDKLRKKLKELEDAGPVEVIVEKQVSTPSSSPTHKEAKHRPSHEDHHDDHAAKTAAPKAEPKAQREGVSQKAYDDMMAQLAAANAKIAQQKGAIQELRAEKEDLESRNDKMLKMLHQLKEQLRKVTEIAEKRGCGDLIKSILEEANVTSTLDSPEFTCFDRLYEDAKRRMEKQRIWEQQRMGLRPKSPMARAQFGSNNMWAPGGQQQFLTSPPPMGQPQWGPPGGQWPPMGQPQWGPPAGQWGPSEAQNMPAYGFYAQGDAQNVPPNGMMPDYANPNYAAFYSQMQPQPLAGIAPALSLDLGSPGSRAASRSTSRGLPGGGNEWMPSDAPFDDIGMHIVGVGQRSFSDFSGMRRPLSSTSMSNDPTRSPTPINPGSSGRNAQLLQSRSLGSLGSGSLSQASAISLDMHPLQGSSPSEGLTRATTASSVISDRRRLDSRPGGGRLDNDIRRALVHSRSGGKLDSDFPSSPLDLAAGVSSSPVIGKGLFTERTHPGPGLFRGFKLLNQAPRGGHRLPPCSPPSRPFTSQDSPLVSGRNSNAFNLTPTAGSPFVPSELALDV